MTKGYSIQIVRKDPVLVFAAEELKKYLRMMLVEGGDVPISFFDGNLISAACVIEKDVFRLGLLEDFGFRNEGAESQQCMLETIDFYAKQEINVYMLEFDNPFVYYNKYYAHLNNEENRVPEPVSRDQVKQWKRQCEAAIAKAHLTMPARVQTLSYRLLLRHADYVEGIAACMKEKARGNDAQAFENYESFRKEFGKYECELERYFDHGLAFTCFRLDVKRPAKVLVPGQ